MSLKRVRRRVTDPVVYALTCLSLRVLGSCSDRMSLFLARCGSGLLWRFYGRGRRLVLSNLSLAFPDLCEAERLRIGRESFLHAIWNGIDFVRSIRQPGLVDRLVELEPSFRDAFQAGQPVNLLILGHLGSWELLGHALPAAGSAGAAVAHTLRNPHLNRLLVEGRGATGLEVIPSDGAVRGMIRAWRQGKHVAVLIDQNTRLKDGGVFVDFFGLPVTVTRGPAMLARKLCESLDLRVCVGVCVRRDGRFRAYSVQLARPVSDYESDEALAQAMMARLEELIREHPEQYVWMYKRWRYIPLDAPQDIAQRYPDYARVYEEGTGRWTES